MADSYPEGDIGSVSDFPRFSLEPNWVSSPQSSILFGRQLVEFRGTAQSMYSITDDAPISFEAKFTIFTLAQYKDFMDFWVTTRGKCDRFWVKHPYRCFKLKAAVTSGDGMIRCYPNFFDKQYQGYERLYIEMSNGDVIARHITAVTYNSVTDQIEIQLNTTIDRDITLTNHVIIGRYLLARFNSDDLEISLHTNTTMDFNLSFTELVREYEEV